jgi:osmotically-inducible protein OsmY
MGSKEDTKISLQITNKLAGRGITTPCRVTVASNKGEVTLTGTVQHPHQRKAAEQAATGITGVRRVMNQLVVKVEKRI